MFEFALNFSSQNQSVLLRSFLQVKIKFSKLFISIQTIDPKYVYLKKKLFKANRIAKSAHRKGFESKRDTSREHSEIRVSSGSKFQVSFRLLDYSIKLVLISIPL
jgi:hypothetical protein